jgi:hypothetical protein
MYCVQYNDEMEAGYCSIINIQVMVSLGAESIAEVGFLSVSVGGVFVVTTQCGNEYMPQCPSIIYYC